MQIQVVSKGIDASEALRVRITGRIEDAVAKYFNKRPGEAFVTIAKEGFGFRADLSLHLPSGALLNTRGEAGEAYAAVDEALGRVEKRLRRYKRKLVDHRQGKDTHQPVAAALMVLESTTPKDDAGTGSGLDHLANGSDVSGGDAPDAVEPDAGGIEEAEEPIIIAETTAELPVLTVGAAVDVLDLTQSPVLMFRNAAHGGMNVVYRRPDGHVGWIDPERKASSH